MLKYILSIKILVLLASVPVLAQTDDSVKQENPGHQLSLGFDCFRPIMNHLLDNREGYEFALDYYWADDIYLVAEGGWGNSHTNYSDLKYSTTNSFLRLGINRSLLQRMSVKDWDLVFLGIRLGTAFINRSAANYLITDSLWGNSSGTIATKNFNGYWMELTGGMRVELFKGFFAGWEIRGKFLLNVSDFKELAPLYVAGYGRGDKSSIFDFNVYLTYAIQWNHQH